MRWQVATVLGGIAALVLAQPARADVRVVRPAPTYGPLQAVGTGHGAADGGDLYDNINDQQLFFQPPNRAVPVEIGMGVLYSGTWHVDNFTFAYGTNIPDTPSGPIEVYVIFYSGLGPDDGPDPNTPVFVIDLPNLPGATRQGNVYSVGPIDLVALGQDFDWPASTSQDGSTNLNWVTFIFLQPRTGPVIASGEDLLGSFWTGADLMPPFGPGSFFWNFTDDLPPAFFLQIGGYAE